MDQLATLGIHPTIMTMLYKYDGIIFIERLFYLLQITQLSLPLKKSSRKRKVKCKIPWPGIPGIVLSLTMENIVRGIKTKEKSESFKNSLMIDISNYSKNVNIKIFTGRFHICGCKSFDQGNETCILLFEKINNIQKMLKWIGENKDLTNNIIEYIIDKTKGDEILFEKSKQEDETRDMIDSEVINLLKILIRNRKYAGIICDKYEENKNVISSTSFGNNIYQYLQNIKSLNINDMDFTILSDLIDIRENELNKCIYSINVPSDLGQNIIQKFSCPQNIIDHLLNYANDKNFHHIYSNFLRDVVEIDSVIDGNMEILSIETPMVNFNYNLGFNIDREWMCVIINNEYPEFIVNFNNIAHIHVSVELPLLFQDGDPLPTEDIHPLKRKLINEVRLKIENRKKKKNKKYKKKDGDIDKHTFLVYYSGKCTMSCPNSNDVYKAYTKFTKLVTLIKDRITY